MIGELKTPDELKPLLKQLETLNLNQLSILNSIISVIIAEKINLDNDDYPYYGG